jgi:hypothetical protein
VYLIEIKIWHLEILAKAMHANVWFGSKADVMLLNFDVRFTPESGHCLARLTCLLWAKSCREQVQQPARYSITSSAVASSGPGIVTPNAFAALRLITSSNLVGRSIGKSAG